MLSATMHEKKKKNHNTNITAELEIYVMETVNSILKIAENWTSKTEDRFIRIQARHRKHTVILTENINVKVKGLNRQKGNS